MRSISARAFDQILKFGKCALMFIGSAWRSETNPEMHFAADRPAMRSSRLIFRQQSLLWRGFVQEFGDRERIPDRDPVMDEAGDQDRRRQQEYFRARVRIVGPSTTISSNSIPASLHISQLSRAATRTSNSCC